MSTAVRLDIIADSQDRATAMLKTVRSELKRTEDQLRQTTAASREDMDVSDVFAQAQSRKLRAQVEANEAAATARRRAVELAREQRSSAGALGFAQQAQQRFTGALSLGSKAAETFSKVMGVAGFVGVVGAAVVGLGALVGELVSTRDAIDEVNENQDRYNALLAETARIALEIKIARSDDAEAKRLAAADQLTKRQEEYFELQEAANAAEAALRLATERRSWTVAELARLEKEGVLSSSTKAEYEARIAEYNRVIAVQTGNAAGFRAAEREYALDLKRLLLESSPLYAVAGQGAQNIAAGMAAAASSAQTINNALAELGKKGIAGAVSGAGVKPPKATGVDPRKAERERIQSIQDEIDLLTIRQNAETEYERQSLEWLAQVERVERDHAAKKISDQERSLQLRRLELEWSVRLGEAQRRQAAEDAAADQRDAERKLAAIAKADEERAKAAERTRLDGIARDVRFIESIGDAARLSSRALDGLYDGLGRITDAMSDSTGLWVEWAKGSKTLGDTLAGTFSTMGAGIAASIKDKKAAALVEGGFEAAASVASFASGNIPAGIGHGVASGMFFALAGSGGSGGGGARAGSGSAPASPSRTLGSFGPVSDSRPRDERSVVQVVYGSGIVYGLGSEVAKAAAGTAQSLRGTNMGRRRY